ncbi:MAG: P22 phage major capsid protein family protein [Stenomitos frigidus ULC029]
MANTLTDVMPKILTTALKTLRENAVMPRLVNSDYGVDAAKKGSVLNIPVPTALVAQDVVPGPFSQTTADMTLNTVQIPLNNWKEVAFYLTDKDQKEIMDGVPNMQVMEAAKALANVVDKSLFALHTGIYNFVGTPGTTPFAPNSSPQAQEATNARKFLNRWLAPMEDRRIVLNVDAEAAALGLPAFQQYLQAGTDVTIRKGQIGEKLGFDWYTDQNAPNYVGGALVGSPLITAQPALGAKTVGFSAVSLTGTLKVGDHFKVAGDSQTYVVTADATAAANAVPAVQFTPGAQVAWAASAVVTVYQGFAVNLAFHRDCFALAIRTLEDEQFMMNELGGAAYMTMQDPITGIPMRLEVKREHKRIRWAIDMLWGVGLVRPEFGCIIAG